MAKPRPRIRLMPLKARYRACFLNPRLRQMDSGLSAFSTFSSNCRQKP